MDHRQKDWVEWLALAEFAVNNKVHTTTKVLSFIANYGRELRMGGDIKRKGKVENATEFVERMKKVHEKAGAALKKVQEEMKKQADQERRETKNWKKEQVEGQKREESKPIEVEGVEEWEVEKILNKRKIRGVKKYLVWWKGFMVENDTWERREDLEHMRELVDKFEGRMGAEVRRQEEVN